MTLRGQSYASFETGAAYLRRNTGSLGTHLQFSFRFALGMQAGGCDLSIGYRHFSKGKGIFRCTDTGHYGEHFVTFELGRLL